VTEIVCTRRGAHDPAEVVFTADGPPPGGALPPMHKRTGPLPWASHVAVLCPVCGLDARLGVERWAKLLGAMPQIPRIDISYL
jgi:hypothetical protein